MTSQKNVENLALLTAIQMLGFIVLEVIVWLLVVIGVLPPLLMLKIQGDVLIQINTAYIVIAGLTCLLVAGFWLALLTEVLGIVELSKVKIKL